MKIFNIKIQEKSYDVAIKKSKKCKRFILKANPKLKRFEISVPYYATYKEAITFFQNSSNWILEKEKLLSFNPFTNIILNDVYYQVNYNIDDNNPNNLEIIKDTINIKAKNKEKSLDILMKYLKKEAKEYFYQASLNKAKILGVSFQKIIIIDSLYKWGSCSSLGNLRYNFRLIMAPDYVLDYIVAHEVAHLKEMNHSKNFWNIVESLTPYKEKAKNWLKKESYILY